MSQGLKNGNLELHNVRVPDYVDAGGAFRVRATITNTAQFISKRDDDRCVGDDPGYEVVLIVSFAGDEKESQPTCVEMPYYYLSKDTEFEISLRAPDNAGSESVRVSMHLPGSGESSGSIDAPIEITEGGVKEPPDDEDGDDDNGDKRDWGDWVLRNPVKAGVGVIGFGIVINQVTR